jgi:DNA-binding winged helix-turn-helix (wHTH) protein
MLFRFDDIELDEDAFELRRAGRAIRVQPKVLQALLYFARQPNRLIPRSELLDGLWRGTIVSDAAVDQVVMQARRAIAPRNRGEAQPLRTVHGKGFRLVATVTAEPSRRDVEGADSKPSDLGDGRVASGIRTRNTAGLVGRTRELQELRLALDDALAGRGAVVLVRGDAGIGKTSLLERFCADQHARGLGIDFHWARCWEAGGAPALWPWRELLRACIAREDASFAQRVLGDQAADLLPLASDSTPASTSRAAGAFESDAQTRFRVFDSIKQVLWRICSQRPLVLLIEDLHAADDASWLLLRFLTGYVREQPLLIVGSTRPLDDRRLSLSAPLLASIATHSIDLSGLTANDIATLAKGRGLELADAAVETLIAATGGNPLLIEHTLRALPDVEAPIPAELIGPAIRVPKAITDSIRRRLQALPQATLAMLKTCSVLGRSFSLPMAELVHAARGDGLALLEPALREGLVESEPFPTSFRFSHVLVRETLYHDLSPVSRSDLHFAFGARLEAQGPPDADTVFRIAHHFLAAASRHGAPKAIEYATKAAEAALGFYAYELAADHYAQAVRLQSQESGGTPDGATLMLALADAERLAGRTAAAGQTLRKVIDLASERGDTELLARALLGLSNLLRSNTMIDPTYEGLLRSALAQLGEAHSLRPVLLATLVEAAAFTAPIAERRQWSEEAIRLARASDAPATLARVIHAVVSAGVFCDDAIILSSTTELMRAARAVSHPEVLLDALAMHAGSLLHTGDGPALHRTVDEHLRLANRVRHPLHAYYAEVFKASRSYLEGALANSEDHTRAALRVGEPVMETLALVTFAVQLAVLAVEHTREAACPLLQEVRTIVDPVLAQVPFTAWEALRGRLGLLVGDRDEARSPLERLTDNDLRALARDHNYAATLGQLAIIAIELDDRVRARQLFEALKPFAGDHLGTAVYPLAYLGPATFYLALLATHCGEHSMGQELFQRAERDCTAIGTRTYLAWTRFHRARALLSTSKGAPEPARQAREWLRAAEQTAVHCGLPRLLAAVVDVRRELLD